MYDLIVVGAGFWGVATELRATARGMNVLTIDSADPDAASPSAAGHITMDWYVGPNLRPLVEKVWSIKDVEESVAWLVHAVGLRQTGEHFVNLTRGGQRRWRPDCYVLTDNDALLKQITPKIGLVDEVVPVDDGYVVKSTCGEYRARAVVMATGMMANRLLKRSPALQNGVEVGALRGRALVVKPSLPDRAATYRECPTTWLAGPYRHWTLRDWTNGTLRIGDTTEKKDWTDERIYGNIGPILNEALGTWTVDHVLDGMRPVAKSGFIVEEVAPRCWVITGGRRVGLGLAGAAAKTVLDRLES